MTQPTYPPAGEAAPCVAHPEVATNLRCSRCERPICPRCLIQTPVGARCRECARLRRLPVFDVTAPIYARASLASAAAGLAAGIVWSFIPLGGLLSFLISGAAGYFVGEAVSRSAYRRRSRGLKALAIGGVVIAYIVQVVFPPVIAVSALSGGFQLSQFLSLTIAATIGVAGQPMAWLAIGIGGFIAAGRID